MSNFRVLARRALVRPRQFSLSFEEAPLAPELPGEEHGDGEWDGDHEEQPQLAVDEQACVGGVRVEEHHAE